MANPVGNGRVVSGSDKKAEGRFIPLLSVDDLLAVMEDSEAPEQLVGYLEHPNVTMIAPIFDRLAAIVCATGDEAAHVAIVARELGIPCAVRVVLEREPSALAGRCVAVHPDGAIHELEVYRPESR